MKLSIRKNDTIKRKSKQKYMKLLPEWKLYFLWKDIMGNKMVECLSYIWIIIDKDMFIIPKTNIIVSQDFQTFDTCSLKPINCSLKNALWNQLTGQQQLFEERKEISAEQYCLIWGKKISIVNLSLYVECDTIE